MDIASVLLVDDDPDIRRIGELSFGVVAGWRTFTAPSGDVALELAALHPVDVIVLDMMMPGRDGISTLAALRTIPTASTTPVVFMTAKVQANEIQQYLDSGAHGVIAKPFDPMTVAEEVRQIVNNPEECA
ncbi:MAG: response regulator [Acidimicrobiia bacterium]